MKLNLNGELVDIARGHSIELRDGFGVEVLCVMGCLWLTEDRVGPDLILRAGDSRRIRSDGRTSITALDPSAMRLIEPARGKQPSIGSRIATLLRSLVAPMAGAPGAARLGTGES